MLYLLSAIALLVIRLYILYNEFHLRGLLELSSVKVSMNAFVAPRILDLVFPSSRFLASALFRSYDRRPE
jgi:hypothetical protein